GLNTRGSGGTLSSSAFASPPKPSKLMPILAAGLALAAVGAFFAGRYLGGNGNAGVSQNALDFRQLTFKRGFVSGARYAPNKAIVYSAAWSGGPIEMFSTQEDNPDSNKLGKLAAHVFAVSKNNDVAVALDPQFELTHQIGTLARIQAGSGSEPQVIRTNVSEADWDPNGANLAIVVVSGNTRRLEYPPGKLLYETAGWIRDIRFSPDGQKIAFFDHQHAVLHGGAVAVVDVKDNAKKTLVDMRPALEGLAWTPDGKEIWFASAKAGEANRIEAVNLEGKTRTVLATPAGMRIHDIAGDGSVLITRLDDFSEMIGVSGSNINQLSWLNASSPRQISADGKRILFTELSQATGPRRAAAIRDISAASVVQRLGEGDALDISQDGTKALAILHGNPTQFVVYSVGGGQPTKIPPSGIIYPNSAQFHPDGQSIIFEGAAAGKFDSLWQQGISSTQARSFTPEGVSMTGHAISPDGEFVCATASDGKLTLYPVRGGTARSIPGTTAKDRFVQWHKDGKGIYAYDPHDVPLHMNFIEIATGNRTTASEFVPTDTNGVQYIEAVLSPDANTAVYGLTHFLSTLQTVKGLK
ncbi:MAG: PD40 domain-containing protein, partial [Acidobacteria bacterium]|nr:PD40 domain-containing protein [Acidobacteriota bacterium]